MTVRDGGIGSAPVEAKCVEGEHDASEMVPSAANDGVEVSAGTQTLSFSKRKDLK